MGIERERNTHRQRDRDRDRETHTDRHRETERACMCVHHQIIFIVASHYFIKCVIYKIQNFIRTDKHSMNFQNLVWVGMRIKPLS